MNLETYIAFRANHFTSWLSVMVLTGIIVNILLGKRPFAWYHAVVMTVCMIAALTLVLETDTHGAPVFMPEALFCALISLSAMLNVLRPSRKSSANAG
ncbi:MAG TPA: hypothetical protein VF438_03275 [Candidatus Paceibacterota bacterium]